jgi:spore coat protein U-like protein
MPAEEVSDAVKEAVGEANVILREYNKAIDFNEVFSISNPIKNGELKIRFTAKGGTSKSYTIGQSSGMSSSSTIRMRYPSTIEDTDNTNPDRAISVWQLAE